MPYETPPPTQPGSLLFSSIINVNTPFHLGVEVRIKFRIENSYKSIDRLILSDVGLIDAKDALESSLVRRKLLNCFHCNFLILPGFLLAVNYT